MKKLFLPLFLIISSVVFGQGVPCTNYQQFGSATTRTAFLGIAHGVKGIVNGVYIDTIQANLGCIDFYPGSQIFTSNDNAIWIRNSTATEWIRQASSSNSPPPSVVTILNDTTILICNVNSCDTFVVNVTAQTINIQNDSTIIVCSFGGSCDTITINPTPLIPTGIYVDSVFVHGAPTTDSLFYSKDGDTTLVHVFDRECGLISPGTVTYNSLLIFDISPSVFIDCCTGIRYTFAAAQVTLAAAHPTLPRRDAIIVSSSGISVITGTAATNPSDPQLASPCQNLLTYITVPAGAISITCASPDIIPYDENTTWTVSTTSVTANPNNTTNPFHLTKSIDVGAVTTASKITLTTTAFDISPYSTFKFYVRLKATFSNSAQITLRWLTTGGAFGSNTLSIPHGSYGFSRTTINSYQAISIPMSDFPFTASTSTITGLQIGFGASNATGFYIDYAQLGGACINQPPVINYPNGFGRVETISGNAISNQPNDTLDVVGAGNVSVSAAGKVLTINGTSTSSTVTIINDSTIQVCTAQGSCQTVVFSDVDAQNVFVVDENTLLVCNVDNTLCDTVNIPNPVFFDRGFFDPNQASFNNTLHTMNGNDLRLIGGTLDINDDGLAINTRSIITPIQAVNDHTDLNNVKVGYIAARRVAGIGAVGLGIGYRVDIDNASSAGVTASNITTEWAVATAGSETATMKFNVLSAGTLANRFSIEGSTRIIADGIRFEEAEGADVTAANDLTLGNGGNAFVINGNTTINAILITNWQGGSKFGFKTTGTPLFKHNTAGGAGTIPMFLQGSADFQAAAGDYIEFRYIDGELHETNRKLAAAAGSYVFSNAITESPAGTVKWGGMLTMNTTITHAGFTVAYNGTVSATAMVSIANAATGGNAALGVTGAGTTGALSVSNTGTGNGADITSVSGSAVNATSTSGSALRGRVNPSSTNTDVRIAQFIRGTTGTAAANMGGYIDYLLEDDGANDQTAVRLIARWSSAADGNESADYIIQSVSAGALADKLVVKADGRTYGTALHNNANAVTGTTNQYIASGTFTSTVSASTNTDATVTVTEGQWIRTGNVVTYSFSFTADPTTTLTTTSFEFTLPVASNIAQIYNLMGTAYCGAISGQGAAVNGVVANDTGKVFWVAADVTNQVWSVTVTYVIL